MIEEIPGLEIVEGWMSHRELMWLLRTARDHKVILEVGSYKGRSAKALAKTHGNVICCDPWSKEPYIFDSGKYTGINTDVFDEFSHNLRKELNSGKVRYVRDKFLSYPWPENFHPDFIFLDGDHRYETVKDEIVLAQKMLKPGGILAGHDYGDSYWPGVKRAVDEAFGEAFQLEETVWYKEF